jgi:hypothetical protein
MRVNMTNTLNRSKQLPAKNDFNLDIRNKSNKFIPFHPTPQCSVVEKNEKQLPLPLYMRLQTRFARLKFSAPDWLSAAKIGSEPQE